MVTAAGRRVRGVPQDAAEPAEPEPAEPEPAEPEPAEPDAAEPAEPAAETSDEDISLEAILEDLKRREGRD